MKFKLDENIPVSLKPIIERVNSSYDVHTVQDEDLSGSKDIALIEYCFEENRIFVTLDTDFLDYVMYPKNKIYSVILLRSKTQGKSAVQKLFLNFMNNFDLEDVVKNVAIVDETTIRIRDQLE